MTWAGLYVAPAVITAAVAFVLGHRLAVDTGHLHRLLLSVLAGLVWPVVVIGIVQLAAIHVVARLVNAVDPPRTPVTPAAGWRAGELVTAAPFSAGSAWPRRAAEM